MLDKIRSLNEKYGKVLVIAWFLVSMTGVLALFDNHMTMASVLLLIGGLLGAPHRLVTQGAGSAAGMVLIYSSGVVGMVFGLFVQIVVALLGVALTFKLLKVKGE
jgi:hypothetical protein